MADKIIKTDYAEYTSSFIEIADERIGEEVRQKFASGLLWSEPLIQLNTSFANGGSIEDLVALGKLQPLASRIFRLGKSLATPEGKPRQLYRHQADAIRIAPGGENYILKTGTGSGKNIAYIVPIVDYILRNGSGNGIKAIIVYPMNALANSQEGELEKFLNSRTSEFPVTFKRYTGEEKEEVREAIIANPPDILLTNYVMLELILTRYREKKLIEAAKGCNFWFLTNCIPIAVGRAAVAMLIRRLRRPCADPGRSFSVLARRQLWLVPEVLKKNVKTWYR